MNTLPGINATLTAPESPGVTDNTSSTARARVASTSDAFLRWFLNVWLLCALVLWAYLYVALPAIQYPAIVMLVAGLPARVALRARRIVLARYLFLTPLCVGVLLIPYFTNGVRTPVMANMPMLVLLAGWLLGKRSMAVLSALFAGSACAYWFAEQHSWWLPTQPLRATNVWVMVWVSATALTAVTVWALISSYEAGFSRQRASKRKLAEALSKTEKVNFNLGSLVSFNQTILQISPIAMAVYASDGWCVEANDAYGQLVGATRAALLTQNFHQIKAWRESKLHLNCLTALSTLVSQQGELHTTSSFGKDVYVEYRILPTQINDELHLLIQFIDLTEHQRVQENLRHLAFHDPLTGLPNRRLLVDRLSHALATGRRRSQHIAVMFLDVNKFKHLNDTLGHEAGDQLLIQVAQRIKQVVRESDTVARFGGDEFVVLLEDLGSDAAQAADWVAAVANKIDDAFAEPFAIAGTRYRSSTSIGVKLITETDDDPEKIMKDADAAMYEAKKRHYA